MPPPFPSPDRLMTQSTRARMSARTAVHAREPPNGNHAHRAQRRSGPFDVLGGSSALGVSSLGGPALPSPRSRLRDLNASISSVLSGRRAASAGAGAGGVDAGRRSPYKSSTYVP